MFSLMRYRKEEGYSHKIKVLIQLKYIFCFTRNYPFKSCIRSIKGCSPSFLSNSKTDQNRCPFKKRNG